MQCTGDPPNLNPATKTFNYLVSLIHSLIHRHLIRSTPLILDYAPDAWDTIIPHDRGWDDPSAVNDERAKWAAFLDIVHGTGPLGFSHEHTDLNITGNPLFHNVHLTFGYVLGLVSRQKKVLSVLDYGGGLGHYFHIGKALFPDLVIEYHCKEVSSMVEAGQQLNPEVVWHSDNECLKMSYDLVMVSGSLQYIQNWQQFLLNLSAPVCGYLFLTRVPVVIGAASFVAVQNAYGTQMLHWQFNREELLHYIDKAGFYVVREFLAGDCPHIKNAPEQCDLRGWLLKLKRHIASDGIET